MSNNVLFVFEGERTEEQIITNLQKFFLTENTTVNCVYGAEIYQIYKEISNDNDLDSFNLIKERNIKKNEILKDFTKEDFAEIYMFFDYDGHSTLADDKKLEELLIFFKEETDKGKLYISYPMVESLKHICSYEDFKDLTVDCKCNIKYKNVVATSALSELINFNSYDLAIWKKLISAHLKKVNYILDNLYILPESLNSQLEIFKKQCEKYINTTSEVSVLSAFPVFLLDYYGCENLKKHIE